MHGLVSDQSLMMMKAILPVCEKLIEGCNSDDALMPWSDCLESYIVCNMAETTPVSFTGVNMYDVRVPCGNDRLCYDFSNIDEYLALDDVRAALGIPDRKKWSECNTLVDMFMVYGGDWMKQFNTHVAEVLESGVRTLIYAGEYDFICNCK